MTKPRSGRRAPTTPAVPTTAVRAIVELAQRAPSVHNTQPWRWRAVGDRLELHADRSRQLPSSDPDGRNLVISCGAALHHAQVAAGALGWGVAVQRLPDPGRPDLLAVLELSPGHQPPPRAAEQLEAIRARRTDRRRYTSWPVPDERLEHLAAEATQWGTPARALTDVSARYHTELLIGRASDLQHDDEDVQDEQRTWIDHGDTDGVPAQVLPVPGDLRATRSQRFGPGLLDDIGGRDIEGSDGLVVIFGHDDSPSAWLAAGEGLSATWLAATSSGLSVVPMSQVIEVPETRSAFRGSVLGGFGHPLIVLRIGWQAIARSSIPATPRRPVDEVLETG